MTSRVSDIQAVSTSKASRYRPEIDGLRAFAVVTVIINHFNKDILPGGYLGVDIFFVISGYVITSSLFGRPSKDLKDFISGFYERRIKRLVPALSVFVLITSIAICLFNPVPGGQLSIGKRALFGFSNIILYNQSTDYFAQSTELNAFAHTWSLGVEEQFYVLFPFLIWFSGFGRQTKNGARNLFLIVGTLSLASLIGFLYLYTKNQPAAYFLMPSRFWEMAAGCLIFLGFQKRASIELILEKVPPLLVLALILGVMYLPISLAAVSTIAVVALSSVLIASLKKQTAAFKIFTHPNVVFIGLISYSLYLWHWGVLSISRWTIGIHWWSVPFQVALMLGLAVASYRWIETPLRKGNWFGKRWKTLVAGGGVLVMVSGSLVTIGKPLKGRIFLGDKTLLQNLYSEDKLWDQKECANDRLLGNIPSASIFENCWVGNTEKKLGKDSSKKRIFSYGNSYNEQLVPAYLNIQNIDDKYAFNAYFTSACTASSKIIPGNEKIPGHCKDVFIEYLNWVRQVAKSGDIVLIANSFNNFLSKSLKDSKSNAPLSGDEALEVYILELHELAKELDNLGVRLYLTSSIPKLKSDPILCRNWFAAFHNNCHSGHNVIDKDYSHLAKRSSDILRDSANQSNPGYSLIDIYTPLHAKLFSSKNPYYYYYNTGHISRLGAQSISRNIYSSLSSR